MKRGEYLFDPILNTYLFQFISSCLDCLKIWLHIVQVFFYGLQRKKYRFMFKIYISCHWVEQPQIIHISITVFINFQIEIILLNSDTNFHMTSNGFTWSSLCCSAMVDGSTPGESWDTRLSWMSLRERTTSWYSFANLWKITNIVDKLLNFLKGIKCPDTSRHKSYIWYFVNSRYAVVLEE